MEVSFSAGEIIFREGDPGESFFEIHEGMVGIFSDYGTPDQTKLSEMDGRHILGEVAIFDMMPRSATAVALTDVTATEVISDEIYSYFDEDTSRISFLTSELCDRLIRITNDYIDACNTLNDQLPENTSSDKSLVEKIKRFTAIYNMGKKYNTESWGSTSNKYGQLPDGYTAGEVHKFKKNTIVFKEGESADCMYGVISGSVDVFTGYGTPEERYLTNVSEGRFFGEIGLLKTSKRTATVVIHEDNTNLEILRASDISEIYAADRNKAVYILRHLAERLRNQTIEYVNVCELIYEVALEKSVGEISDFLMEKVRGYMLLL